MEDAWAIPLLNSPPPRVARLSAPPSPAAASRPCPVLPPVPPPVPTPGPSPSPGLPAPSPSLSALDEISSLLDTSRGLRPSDDIYKSVRTTIRKTINEQEKRNQIDVALRRRVSPLIPVSFGSKGLGERPRLLDEIMLRLQYKYGPGDMFQPFTQQSMVTQGARRWLRK